MKDAFAEAIGICIRGWQERWNRPPTTRELVHAFEVCLAASADEYVADPAAARELFLPTKPAAKLSPAFSCKVTWPDAMTIELTLTPPRNGSLRCIVEATKDGVLFVDYWVSIYPEPPTDADIRRYLAKHAIAAWQAKHPQPLTRAIIRSVQSLADPVELVLG